MGRTILQQVNGFTPVIDLVAQDVGFVTAAVYGVHWRFCQMQDGISRAAMDTIAHRLDISTKTARRHTQKLCDHGYLQNLTPNVRHKPHIYRDTGKVIIEGLLQARLDSTSNLTAERLDLESNPVGQRVQPGWSESPTRLDRESTKDSSKIEEKEERDQEIVSSLWDAIQGSLQGMMERATFEVHFARAVPLGMECGELVVALPNPQSLEAMGQLMGRIRDCVRGQHGVGVRFVAQGGEDAGRTG